jgi:pyridinium-3,5-biscarboxylic acid mononucleotide synthase
VSVAKEIVLDFARERRIGLEEAIYCDGKSLKQIEAILDEGEANHVAMLLTRLHPDKYEGLASTYRDRLDYCEVSRTAIAGSPRAVQSSRRVAVVCAGTSDVPVAREAVRTLHYHGEEAPLLADIGVAGLWRLTTRLDELRRYPVIVVVAGMDAALPTVLGGLIAGAIIAVPTSVGYGVAEGGRAALSAILASCSPGIVTVNIDNGYGAACAALRLLHAAERLGGTYT